jgi:hypothetical protein
MRRAPIAVGLVATAAVLTGCTGKTTPLICNGTVEKVGDQSDPRPSEPVVIRIEKYPAYAKLYNKSYGSLVMSEPTAQYYSHIEEAGDQLLISEPGNEHVLGMFNKISGRFRLISGGQSYELSCEPTMPLTP